MQVKANPFWPHETDFPRLAGAVNADVVVVGGGIAGVCSAYFLGAKGYKVALIEARQIASAATGASSGTLFYGSGTDFQQAVGLYGLSKAKVLFHETAGAIRELAALVEKEKIACGLRHPGIIDAARDEKEADYVRAEMRASAQIGFPGRLVEGDEMARAFSGKRFVLGIEHECGQLHPGQFAAGLAGLARSAHGVEVYENTEMRGIEETGGKVAVKAAGGGSVAADKAVVATNLAPFKGLEKHFFAENTTVVPSKPLGARVRGVFAAEKIIETVGERYDMLYPIGDRVFLEVYSPQGAEKKFGEYFPAGVEADAKDSWGDSWAKTRDFLPIAGLVSPRVAAAVAMGDQGIVMGFACGRKMPGLVEGKSDAFLDLASPARFARA